MPRMKRTARKQPMEDAVYEEPPQDYPLGKYFKNLNDLNGYMIIFSDRKEIPPRIDLSEEISKTLGNSGVIDIRTLHHMGRAMEDQGQEEETPQAHQAPQVPQASHEPQAGSSQQPSMLDLMHDLQRIEQNQDRMDRRFQRVDRRLHRIEQYLEIEEDEDEDQD
ncbi:hypothetical protein PIB30_059383 [Stylosanthes scabra]|uniref:Uncharacterized protein n=1 Tax=Stylosanthes scabra TaxID=79078 RepID=A0ABU6RK73_9FABA|nr:hypothetical protein [Stylosanthes scabra]